MEESNRSPASVSSTESGGVPGAEKADVAPPWHADELESDTRDSWPTWRPHPGTTHWQKAAGVARWLPRFAWQRVMRRPAHSRPVHLLVAIADHYEPEYAPRLFGKPTSEAEQVERVERWCKRYRDTVDDWRDGDGRPLAHTYFLPAEEYRPRVVERVAEFAREGYGEVEIQLHHGVWEPDTAENTRRVLETFRDVLVRNGCLSRWDGVGPTRYAFVHGNWALANSEGGRFCGVDNEMAILAATGCFADFTLPSAPSEAQITKINSLYECTLPLEERAPHRSGRNLKRGRPPERWPLIMQGPLGLYFARHRRGVAVRPRLDNAEISATHPPTLERIDRWRRTAITVQGRPDWVFIKLHCHGLDPMDAEAMVGPGRAKFLSTLTDYAAQRGDTLHYVTAREMVNIALAACDGREGDPGDFRDYRLQLITPRA